jgi:hypothetical protein
MPFPHKIPALHAGGMTANSRELSGAIPPEYDLNRPAPRRGASKRRLNRKSSGSGVTAYYRLTLGTPSVAFAAAFTPPAAETTSLVLGIGSDSLRRESLKTFVTA